MMKCQQAYKQAVPASIQADRPALQMSRGYDYTDAWAPTVPASIQANRASKHTSKPCQQAYKQPVPGNIQASVRTSIQADRPAFLMSRGYEFTDVMRPNRASKHTSKPCQQAYTQQAPTNLRNLRGGRGELQNVGILEFTLKIGMNARSPS